MANYVCMYSIVNVLWVKIINICGNDIDGRKFFTANCSRCLLQGIFMDLSKGGNSRKVMLPCLQHILCILFFYKNANSSSE